VQEIQFALGPVELELQVEATQEAGVKGGFKFWLASADASASRTSGRTHTVRLTLTPVRADAEGERHDVLVATDLEARD
jgi:Trypsin-co-occurring domain 2